MNDSELLIRSRSRVGSVLRGKYRIDRVLGVGGMAVVYATTHVKNRAELAIKMLHPELSIREDIKARFLREGYVGNSVRHNGAVKVLDDDVAEDGAAFLVMELLDGTGVEQVWDKYGRRLPVRAVLAIAHQLLDVLAAAHEKQIVHRDIKPANLFLTREGVVKVLDFGIARLRDATSESATHTGMLLGTPAFMAPEQALAQSSKIDGLSDVWAAGATMFSLLTGETVHVGENAQQLMVQAATRPSRSLASVASGVSPRVAGIVDRALAFDKGARWRSAVEMRDAVRDAYLAEFSTNITPAPLAAMFNEAEGGRAATFYADAIASTPLADQRTPPTRASAGFAPAAQAQTPIIAPTLDQTAVPPPRPAFVGTTTAQPVSSERIGEESVRVPRSSSGRLAAGIAAVVGVVVIGGGVVTLKYGAKHDAAAGSGEAALSTATTPTPSTTPPPSPAPAPAPIPSQTPTSIPSTTPPHPLAGLHPGAVPSASAHKGAPPQPSAAAAAAPPPAAPAAPTCHVEFYVNQDGETVPRRVCQ